MSRNKMAYVARPLNHFRKLNAQTLKAYEEKYALLVKQKAEYDDLPYDPKAWKFTIKMIKDYKNDKTDKDVTPSYKKLFLSAVMYHLNKTDAEGFKGYEEYRKTWDTLKTDKEKEAFLLTHNKQTTADALIHYKHLMEIYSKSEQAHADSQTYTKKQEENIITWDEVVKVRESLPKDSQDYMMISLYTQDMPPVRCDYTPMRAFLTQEEAVGYAENHIVVNDKEATIHILKYKTDKSHGPIIEPLPPVIKKIVQSYMLVKKESKTELKQQWLLLDKSKKVMSKASLSGNVIKIFNDAIGKKVGITLLRVIHNTAKGEGERPIAEKAKIARVMGHSVKTGETYAKKPRSPTQSNEIVMAPKAKPAKPATPAKTVKMADGTIRKKATKVGKVGKKITFEVL